MVRVLPASKHRADCKEKVSINAGTAVDELSSHYLHRVTRPRGIGKYNQVGYKRTTQDDAPYIDIWPSSFFPSLVAPTHPLNPCRPSTDLNEPGRAHTRVKPPRGASTNWLPPSKAGHQRCRGDKNGSLLGARLALLRLVGTRHYATFTPLMPP